MSENEEDLNLNLKRFKTDDFNQNDFFENNVCLENSFSTDNSIAQEIDQHESSLISKVDSSDTNNLIENDKQNKDLSKKLTEIIRQKAQIKIKKNKRHMKQKKNNLLNQNIQNARPQQYYELSDNSDSDVPLDDIDDMLEEGLKESLGKDSIPSHEERKKVVLKKREQDYFEMLPEGWIEVTHFSGMPVYLHKVSRVCTLAKPYYLGSGSTRKHEIPVSAIPCLAYKKELEKEKELDKLNKINNNELSKELNGVIEEGSKPCNNLNENEDNCLKNITEDFLKIDNLKSMNDLTVDDSDEISCVKNLNEGENKIQNSSSNLKHSFIAKVETVKDNKKKRSLNYMTVREYCEKVFEFQEITIRKFKTWADRRNHMQQRKLAQRPSLPEGTKLITCPLPVNKEQPEIQGRNMRKEFVMNPAGKSSVCILHEFVQHAERVQPKYVFQELENANTPYSATVIINDMQYGTGYGSSKKQAKSEAAKATLEILIPDMKDMTQNNKKPDISTNDLSFFDDIKVEDPRVSELCAKAGQHSPYQILVECLRRNCGMGDTDITTNVRLVKHQKNEFTMKVGNHVATVICRNKREGKQRAAQAILQLLHPQITNWGSLLRLYGRGSCKTPKEKKEEEQKITELQNTACANKPNYAILNKLREEMLKLRSEENSTVIPFSGILGDEQQLNVEDLLKK